VQILHTSHNGQFDEPQIFSIVASAPSVKFRNPHPVSAFSPAAPSPHTVLARVVEKSGAIRHERVILV
jgi:hypothetical protein